jgi:hypothetical protein
LEIKEANRYFLDSSNVEIPELDEDDKDRMEQPITPDELSNALSELNNNKSPGIDGLPPEFYKLFWKNIKVVVCQSILHGIHTGKMSIDQRRAVLTLLPKKDKDHRFIKNWRPLSLLNTDYKILAKALATRLQTSLDVLVNTDQSGGIKGRSTFSNIRSTIDIINFTRENNMPGFLAFIDYEKAFDTVKWPFLFSALKKMNFGSYFVGCIKTLYEDIGTIVSNCGFLSQQFNPKRGIRQGCPISANLFILIVEILACCIRQNKRISGIKIGEAEFKISQYADDMCAYIKDLQSLKTLFEVLDIFTKCSGLNVNRDKSEAIGIGTSSNFKHRDLGIKWPDTSIRCLGVQINVNTTQMVEDNFKPCLERIEHLLSLWCLRRLTLKGKVLIINTLIISQLLYICTVLNTPKWVIDKYNDMVRNFVWDGKPAKIKYK